MTGWSCHRFGRLIPFLHFSVCIALFFTTRATPGGSIPSNSNFTFTFITLNPPHVGNSGNSRYIRRNRSRSYGLALVMMIICIHAPLPSA
ncbi:hypothetical protein BDR04DRAFT_173359 [Suillus decipiens]|nr:hypothetical protein BDR04DRAFT_173359 [Suillus decipiens]